MEQPASGLPAGLLSYCGGFYTVPAGAGFAELSVCPQCEFSTFPSPSGITTSQPKNLFSWLVLTPAFNPFHQ